MSNNRRYCQHCRAETPHDKGNEIEDAIGKPATFIVDVCTLFTTSINTVNYWKCQVCEKETKR